MKRLCLPAAALLLSACATTTLPLVPIPVPLPRIPFIGGDDINLSRKDWGEACQKLAERMQEEYPYTEHKGINWSALGGQLAAEASAAEEAQDEAALYAALRRFVESLHDGNVILSANAEWLGEQFGGSFRMELAMLDDGRVLVESVEEGGPADKAGVKPLNEMLTWNGVPMAQAVAAAPMLWSTQAPATMLDQRRHRLRGLTRVAAGTEAAIAWRAPDGAHSATITAEESAWEELEEGGLLDDMLPGESGQLLESRWLNNDTGYIKVRQLAPSLSSPFPGRAFNNTLTKFREEKARHLVLDLRGNTVGLDEFAAELAGYLVPVEDGDLYRNLALYNARAEAFEVDEASAVRMQQHDAPGLSPVMVLIDEDTSRAAETLAWTLKQRGAKGVIIVGDGPTRGITTVLERSVDMPGGNRITYPIARWLGPEGNIVVEANAAGDGGVVPDIPVPAVESTLSRAIKGEDLALQKAMDFLSPAK